MNRINISKKMSGGHSCPKCGAKMRFSAEIHGRSADPRPGDFSLCFECATPGRFNDNLEMVALDEDGMNELMSDPGARSAIELARKMVSEKGISNDPVFESYKESAIRSRNAVRDWIKNNPGTTVTIQYNFNDEVAVIASIDDAVEMHYISASEDAKRMFRELGWMDKNNKDVPTVNMFRIIMDSLFKQDENN